MAGGIGSRFWPMSTPECPKQFIDVLGCGRTLLQLTADRFKRICFPENIWVVTSEAYADIVREQLPEIPESNILKEPCRRNTAPCIAYVSWRIKKLNPKANVVVTPSDHIVMDVAEFERVITSGLAFTAETDSILTLGMKPNRPETGYGYIQADLGFASARTSVRLSTPSVCISPLSRRFSSSLCPYMAASRNRKLSIVIFRSVRIYRWIMPSWRK